MTNKLEESLESLIYSVLKKNSIIDRLGSVNIKSDIAIVQVRRLQGEADYCNAAFKRGKVRSHFPRRGQKSPAIYHQWINNPANLRCANDSCWRALDCGDSGHH